MVADRPPTVEEIGIMRDLLEENIAEHGWDSSVDAASRALQWVLSGSPFSKKILEARMERSASDRRSEWIARGGDPVDWSLFLENVSSEDL